MEFTCYPYKIHAIDEGDDLWDPFEFDNDVAQELKFNIDGGITTHIYNTGLTIVKPRITVSGKAKWLLALGRPLPLLLLSIRIIRVTLSFMNGRRILMY